MNKLYLSYGLAASVAITLCTPVSAQDPTFSQFYASPVYSNPAMAGAGLCGGRISVNYRNQWPSLPGTFVTNNFSYDHNVRNIGGVGLMFSQDVAGQGLLTTNIVSGVYSYELKATRKMVIKAGIQASVIQKSIDWSRLTFSDMIDPIRGFVKPTHEVFGRDQKWFPNFSTGILAFSEKFYAGVAIHNLTEPNQSFFNTVDAILPRRYTAHAGTVIALDKKRRPESTLSPNILFSVQDKFTQINLGFYLTKNSLVTGLWFRQGVGYFRTSDAIILMAGFKKERFKAGYSYDITVSDGRSAATGSHEISATYEWCNRPERKVYRNYPCPVL